LISRIESDLGQSLNPPVLFRAPTVESLARILREGDGHSSEYGVVALQPSGRTTPLFCLNWTFLYRNLARRLAPDQPVYAVYSPIEDELRAAVAERSVRMTLEELAGRYVELIRATQPRGPYRLAGISFGGVLAYEVAQQLCRAGETVERLALLDSLLPRAIQPAPLGQVRRAAHHLRQALRRGPGYLFGKLKARRHWRKQLRQSHSQSAHDPPPSGAQASVEQIEQLRIWWTDEIVRRYRPVTYPGAALLLRARERAISLQQRVDHSNGWSDLIAGGLEIEEVPGNHLTFYSEPHAAVLAQKLKSFLDDAPKPAGEITHASSTTTGAEKDTRTERAIPASRRPTTSTKSLLLLTWFEKMRILVE
jgi:thioesterase domain-containing protein